MEGEWQGGWRMRASMLAVSVGRIVINGSSSILHMAMVPPLALEVSRVRSGEWRSSELRWQEKSPLKVSNRRAKSC